MPAGGMPGSGPSFEERRFAARPGRFPVVDCVAMECARCGADVDPSATVCEYCRAPTPYAERVQAEERAREEREKAKRAEAAKRERDDARQRMEQAASRSFAFALVGMVVCFIPILQIVSVVSYLRARSLSRQLSEAVPWKGTMGFVLSALWLLLVPALIVFAIIRDNGLEERTDARIAVLDAQVRTSALQQKLDWATACALAEIHALKNGYGDQKGKNLIRFDCSGKTAGTPDRPMLEHFSFGSELVDERFDVAVCFERGATWYVKEMTKNHTCR